MMEECLKDINSELMFLDSVEGSVPRHDMAERGNKKE